MVPVQERTADDALTRLGALLQAALALPPAQRSAWLESLGPADRGLRPELEELLARAARPLDQGSQGSAQTLEGALAEGPTVLSAPGQGGEPLGPFRLLQPIAAGGMGQVWLAEQTGPVRRKVALKVIKAGMDSKEVIARFESERQALALMDHPAIAKVIDAGTTPQGRPYFAMEYVAGIPIDRYCVEHQLSVPERLALFVQVCEGVQHAHQKAIIHRDLKPSNILVTTIDDQPQAKIIDFGIAKAIGQRLTDKTLFTEIGAVIGTPEYMSPEQATLTGEGIDTRTDVYALGVVLFELLTRSLPFGARDKDTTVEELRRRIREDEPPKPSTRVRVTGHGGAGKPADRPASPSMPLVRLLRGDLDAVTLKALEKDRRRRYGSPGELAADLGRYLKHEAVLAVPPSASYRIGKFVRRHRFGVATVIAFALVLIAATAVSIRQGLRADREAAAARAVNDFLQNDLLAQASADNQAGPGARPDPELRVRTALDRAAARLSGKFDRQPELEAAIRSTIGRTYRDLGQYPEAAKQLERALELQRQSLGAESPKTLDTLSQLGDVYRKQGRYPEGEALYDRVIAASRRVLGPEHPDTLNAMYGAASLDDLQGKYPQSEALHRQVLEVRRRVLGPEHPDTLESTNSLAAVLDMEGKYPESEALYRQTIEARRRVLGPEHPKTLWSMNELAWVYIEESKYAQSEELYLQTIEGQRRVLGAEHPNTLASMNGQGYLYNSQGKYPQAEKLWSQTLESARRVLGPEHPNTLAIANNLAEVSDRQGKYAQAEAIDLSVLEVRRRVLGPEHPDTLASMSNLATAWSHLGRYPQADKLYRETLEIQRRAAGPESAGALSSLAALAANSQRQGSQAAAVAFAAQALAGRRHALGAESPDTLDAAAGLALAYQSQGRFAESEPLAREAVELDRKLRPDDWERFRDESLLGRSLLGQKEYADAEPLLLQGYQGLDARRERIAVPDSHQLSAALEAIVRLYRDWGKPKQAAEWRQRLQAGSSPK